MHVTWLEWLWQRIQIRVWSQFYGYLANKNVSDGDLLSSFLSRMHSEKVWKIIDIIAENKNASDKTFDRIVEEMDYMMVGKDKSSENIAITSILSSCNFKDFDEFVKLFFN